MISFAIFIISSATFAYKSYKISYILLGPLVWVGLRSSTVYSVSSVSVNNLPPNPLF